MKKTVALVLALLMLLALFTGCGNKEETKAPVNEPSSEGVNTKPNTNTDDDTSSAKPLKVAVLTGSLTATPFCVSMGEEINTQMKAEGWDLSVFDADMDATKQSTQFETALMMEPDVIVYWCRDSAAAVEDVKKAAEAGVPVIMLNNDVDKTGWDYTLCFVGPDQYGIGYDLATYMMEYKESANIAIVDGLANNTTYNDRYNGFMDAIKDNPDYKVLVHDYCNADRTTAQTMTENYLTGFPEMDTIVAFSDNFAIGSINAITAANRNDIDVFSIDGMQIGFDAINNGTMVATVLQTPGYQIAKVIEVINDVIVGGGTVTERRIFSGHYVVDKNNTDEFVPAY